jgi:hypothetical protein
MATGHNVFDPADLDLAQAIFDDIWSSLPASIRTGTRKAEFKDWLAKQVLTSIKNREVPATPLKARVMDSDFSAWA